MNYPDNENQKCVAVAWLAIAVITWSIVLLIYLCSGCTYNRNAPLINVQDAVKGNTIPLIK